MTSRVFVVMVGGWLVVSAFAWPHTGQETVSVATVGVLSMIFALLSMSREWPRYANVALAAWLILSTFRFATANPATLWHNAIMGVAIFAGSLLGGGPRDIRHEREIYSGA